MAREIASSTEFLHTGNARQRCNRTAATTVPGSVGFVDHVTSDAASTTLPLGQQNVVAVTTALMAMRPQLVVFAGPGDGTGVANTKFGRWNDSEDGAIVQILVNAGTAVAKGDWLKPVNAQNYLVKGTLGTDFCYAQSLEAKGSGIGLVQCRLFSNGRL